MPRIGAAHDSNVPITLQQATPTRQFAPRYQFLPAHFGKPRSASTKPLVLLADAASAAADGESED